MSWSLGEIRALSVKAARGSGMDWGIAEEAGFVVQWLEEHGLNGVRALAQYLSRVRMDEKYNDEHCPLILGCLVSDMNNWEILQGKNCYEPMLLIPFLSNVVKDQSLSLSWVDANALISGNGIKTDDIESLVSRPSDSKQRLHIELGETSHEVLSNKTRVSENEASYVAILNALAHKVYAPATEASRLSGAGAGLNDND